MNREQRRAWRENNPEEHRREQRLYYSRHKEKVKRRTKRLKQEHPERDAIYKGKRRTFKTLAGGYVTPEQWRYICRTFKFRCLGCSKKKRLQIDHVVPVCKGGTSWPSNLQPLCATCNQKKQTKSTDFRVLSKWQASFAVLRRQLWFCSESKTLRKR
jgi:5-methylcytosine-specific restriction endonuclease McrA